MTTTDEQAILDRADGCCLANRREFRWIRADGMFNVGWLARSINLGVVDASDRRLTPEMVATMVADVTPLSQSDQVGAFADLTLAAPCLVIVRPDGREVLIDGLKRARQSFALGRPDVPAKVISLEDAQRLSMSVKHRESWKVLKATSYHPVGAQQKCNFDKTIVELSDDREAETPGRGQPSFSDEQDVLSDSSVFSLIALTEVEYYVYSTNPGIALFKHIKRGLTRPAWVEMFLLERYRSGRISVPRSTSEVANQAKAAMTRAAGVESRAAYKRIGKATWLRMSPEALAQERDATLDICTAVTKADLRLRLKQTFSRKLVKTENTARRTTSWRDVHFAIEGVNPDDDKDSGSNQRNLFDLSRLRLEEQLIVTQLTGVNMNDVYHDHTNIDPLFQAYAFAFWFARHKRALADPCMVEAVVHRRAMDILGQRDGLTDCWEALFEHWRALGLTDAMLLDIVRVLDAAHSVHDGLEVLVGSRLIATPRR